MPRGNGTGPGGEGAMTGRGAGFCRGAGVPGYASTPRRGGLGRGAQGAAPSTRDAGGGRGWRNMFFATGQPGWARTGNVAGTPPAMAPEQERRLLKERSDVLTAELERIAARLSELEVGDTDK